MKMKTKEIHNFAIDRDEETLKQFKNCYEQKFVVKAALMPDAHRGYVAPIGSVLVTENYVVPSWVGYDIGCGMTAVRLKGKNTLQEIQENKEKIYNEVKRNIPMGLGEINKPGKISQESKKEYEKLIEKFKKGSYNKEVLQFLEKGKAIRHVGSLGHGNHFISLNKDDSGFAWIVVHSGSRGVGHWVAKFYMKKSAGKEKHFEETYPLEIKSQTGKEYLNLLEFGLGFALLNRMEMIRKTILSIEKVLGKKISYEVWTNKNHNHALKENSFYVHRKGATPAKKSERGVIPANMRDGSFLVEGKGNKEFLQSSSHGAGRAMSRRQAKNTINLEKFKKEMKDVVGNFSKETLDEAPEAYKNIYEVLDAQKKSIKIIKHLTPIINWQGERTR